MNLNLILMISFAILILSGVYHILAGLFNLPSGKAVRTVRRFKNSHVKKDSILTELTGTAANVIANFIKIDSYKRNKLKTSLNCAGIRMSPELYASNAIACGLFWVLVAIPCFFIMPVFVPVFIFMGIFYGVKEYRSVEKVIAGKRADIEAELPRFTATLKQSVSATKDIFQIINRYKDHAGANFRRELEITVADMQSGSQEIALTRLEARVGSGMLSDLVRGMIAVIRGDDGGEFFRILEHDFKQLELQRLKADAMKRPAKVKKYSLLIMGCFFLIYIVVLGMNLISSLAFFS